MASSLVLILTLIIRLTPLLTLVLSLEDKQDTQIITGVFNFYSITLCVATVVIFLAAGVTCIVNRIRKKRYIESMKNRRSRYTSPSQMGSKMGSQIAGSQAGGSQMSPSKAGQSKLATRSMDSVKEMKTVNSGLMAKSVPLISTGGPMSKSPWRLSSKITPAGSQCGLKSKMESKVGSSAGFSTAFPTSTIANKVASPPSSGISAFFPASKLPVGGPSVRRPSAASRTGSQSPKSSMAKSRVGSRIGSRVGSKVGSRASGSPSSKRHGH